MQGVSADSSVEETGVADQDQYSVPDHVRSVEP